LGDFGDVGLTKESILRLKICIRNLWQFNFLQFYSLQCDKNGLYTKGPNIHKLDSKKFIDISKSVQHVVLKTLPPTREG
jgi:hypothetical protein